MLFLSNLQIYTNFGKYTKFKDAKLLKCETAGSELTSSELTVSHRQI